MAENEKLLPVFVAGPARSGTTMLTLALSAHPEVCLAPENRFVPALLRRTSGRGILRGESLESFRRKVFGDRKLNALKVDMSRYRERVASYEEVAVRDAILDFLACYRDQVCPGAHCVGQKKNFLEIWRPLKRALPEARLVTIFRDPRSAAASAAKNLAGRNVVSAAQRWAARAREADAFREAFPGDYMELRYESFVADPEQGCRDLCTFLGIPFDARMLAHYEDNADHARVLAGHEDKHARTAQPINPDRIDSWRKELSGGQVHLVEAAAREEMHARGYEPCHSSRYGTMERAGVQLRMAIENSRGWGAVRRAFSRHRGDER